MKIVNTSINLGRLYNASVFPCTGIMHGHVPPGLQICAHLQLHGQTAEPLWCSPSATTAKLSLKM